VHKRIAPFPAVALIRVIKPRGGAVGGVRPESKESAVGGWEAFWCSRGLPLSCRCTAKTMSATTATASIAAAANTAIAITVRPNFPGSRSRNWRSPPSTRHPCEIAGRLAQECRAVKQSLPSGRSKSEDHSPHAKHLPISSTKRAPRPRCHGNGSFCEYHVTARTFERDTFVK
jgi:hypothetical protein